MAVSPSVQELLWRPHNLLSKDEALPRPLRRVEQYRRAITPETGAEHLRPCGRKGGHVVPQPLTRRVLQPLGNVFVGCRVRAGEVRVRTQEGARNAWFHANRGREAERALKRARFLLSRGIDPASGVGCAVPLRAAVAETTATAAGGQQRRPRAAGGRKLSAAGEEEILGVRRAGDERAPSSALDAEFAATVAGTRGKYKMGKWIPHAETVWDVYKEVHIPEEHERLRGEIRRLSLAAFPPAAAPTAQRPSAADDAAAAASTDGCVDEDIPPPASLCRRLQAERSDSEGELS